MLCDDLGGRMGKVGRRPTSIGRGYKHMANLIHVHQKLTHCKAIVPPIKINLKKEEAPE